MAVPSAYQQTVERACSTEPGGDDIRKAACDEITSAIRDGKFTVLDLALLLAVPLTSPEKEAREHGTRLLGEVVSRCRGVLLDGELHTLAEFLAARLRDWPCVGAAATACQGLLAQPPSAGGPTAEVEAPGEAAGGASSGREAEGPGRLREESAVLVLEATAEVLRTAQSFRQEERAALLRLLLTAARGWGRTVAARPPGTARAGGEEAASGGPGRGPVDLLEPFLGAADGEKDPRCLLLAFEAAKALCDLYHDPRVDPAPLRALADEVADWASSYFPISFNPPPSMARGPGAITRAQLAASLEAALAASPFLAGGVLPLLVEKLSSTYRPAKQDALSALQRCCPAFGPEAIAVHAGQLWPALRGEILAPCGRGGAGPGGGGSVSSAGLVAPPGGPGGGGSGGGGGDGSDTQAALAVAAAGCLTAVVRSAGPGVVDRLALQDASIGDLLSIVRSVGSAGSATHGSVPSAAGAGVTGRADLQVLCGGLLLAAIAAAGPGSLQGAHSAALAEIQALLTASLTAENSYDISDQTLYGIILLTAVIDAVAADMGAVLSSWFAPSGAAGLTALTEVRSALLAALHAVHLRLGAGSSAAEASTRAADVDMTAAPEASEIQTTSSSSSYSAVQASELRLASIAAWRALLNLHEAAGARTAAAGSGGSPLAAVLLLPAAELAVAAEQLCACALPPLPPMASSPLSSQPLELPYRMRWGVPRVRLDTEAAAVLQRLLQVSLAPSVSDAEAPAGAAPPPTPSSKSSPYGVVVNCVVSHLVDAMAAADGGGEGAEEDQQAGVDSRRGVALRLAVRLAQPPSPSQAAAPSAEETARAVEAAVVFAGGLVDALPPLLLGLRGGQQDEDWLLDCLHQLTAHVLPSLAWTPLREAHMAGSSPPAGDDTPRSTTATAAVAVTTSASTASTSGSTCASTANTAAAARRAAAAILVAAAAWEAAGGAGLPFASSSSGDGGGDGSGSPVDGEEGNVSGSVPSSPSSASGHLMGSWCGAAQHLVAACDDRQQLELALEAAECIASAASAAAASPSDGPTSPPQPHQSLPAAAARLPLSCAIVAGLRPALLAPQSTQALAESLVTLLASASLRTGSGGSGGGGGGGAAPRLSEQALSTAAVALAAAVNRWRDAASLDAWLAAAFRPALLQPAVQWSTTSSAATNAAVVMVRAVGWVGRALALRNHPSLEEVVQALLTCLGGGKGAAAMELDTQGAPAAAAKVTAAALEAAEAFGVMVMETAAAGGVCLAARRSQAVCRVLWQQRSYSLCMQALANHLRAAPAPSSGHHTTTGYSGSAPVPWAVAVCRLTGSAPRALCRQDAPRQGPLLLRAAGQLASLLTSPCGVAGASSAVGAPAAAPAAAAAAAEALRVALAVLRCWLELQKEQPSEQLGQVLQDNTAELVTFLTTAGGVGAAPASLRNPPAHTPVHTPAVPPAAVLPVATAVMVREEALQCCTALMDAVPYHVLHPLRSTVQDCVVRALDDNRRSVRQLAVKARRVWSDK